MSTGKRRAARARRPGGSGVVSNPEYQVGFGKPPREHRFKPGQSGNRKGRPKGAKNTATLLRELLNRKIEVRANGKLRKISLREAMLTRFAEAALKGDTKSASFLLQLEKQQETQIVVRKEVELKTEEDVKAALLQRGLPESTLRQLEFHDPKILDLEAEN